MTSSSATPSRDAIEHARLVLNAIAQFESLLQPVFEARTPAGRRELSQVMTQWLAETPNATLRAALLDQPCPAQFFEKWISATEVKTWLAAAPIQRCQPAGGQVCIRPSEVALVLRSLNRR